MYRDVLNISFKHFVAWLVGLLFLCSFSHKKFSLDNITSEYNILSDRQVLMDLYEATGGDGWFNNHGWGQGNPSSEWHGVVVDRQGRVIRLNLRANNLRGQLPVSIGRLANLTYLNVKQNHLTGSLTEIIG